MKLVSPRTGRRRRRLQINEILSTMRTSQEIPQVNVQNINSSCQPTTTFPAKPGSFSEVSSLDGMCNSNEVDDDGNITLSSDFSDEASIEVNETVTPLDLSLREWVLQHNIKHAALRDLLKIMNNAGHKFPNDPRTLMRTPKCIQVTQVSGGQFVYLGIENYLISRLPFGLKCSSSQHSYNILQSKVGRLGVPLITLTIGIDGIPVSKSSNKQFWPILGKINQSNLESPFVIGIFYGESKPKNQEFLKEFIDECKRLELGGFWFNNIKYEFRISKLLADAPARSFIKSSRNHNSYHGCEKCTEDGEYFGRVVYPSVNYSKRSDEDFKNQIDSLHHTSTSIFNELDFGMVSQVPLDYLHLVCLGVVRKLLRQWVKGDLPYRLRSQKTLQIGSRMQLFRKYFPSCFQRLPRSVVHVDNFKGSEFRSFILYTGAGALVDIIPRREYKNFLRLHCAMFILLSKKADNLEWNGVAESLLKEFVTKCIILYGVKFAVYNVHGLLHIHDDAILFGNLDQISTFPFENYMQQIKRWIHSHNYFLEQVSKRILENEILHIDMKKRNEVKINEKPWYTKIYKRNGNCFMLKTGKIIVFREYLHLLENAKVKFMVQYFEHLQRVDHYPIDSTKLGIFLADKLGDKVCVELQESDLLHQCTRLPYKKYFMCFPLLHSIN
ncbi:uncharacterized protein LOC118435320 [Folsomia candida]|uniref:uncharacterized protein LOC118435320 n=1 Tax=Folsomia candida TaxID=158441 RepID=UPI0016050116|nr:uncharacterized protein LOC118435320 [Folsomia candida]